MTEACAAWRSCIIRTKPARWRSIRICPACSFYTGNFIESDKGKDGKTYDFRGGFAMETQFFPDTPNKPQFPTSVFGPKRHYHTVMEYRFG
nr:hypothetical protein [Eisenbergiella massiliensis]